MYRRILGLLLISSLLFGNESECEKDYYKDGKLKYTTCFDKDKNLREESMYHPYSGFVEMKDLYDVNGSIMSAQRYFEGILHHEIIYKNDKEIKKVIYFQLGKIKSIKTKDEDKEFYPNGQIAIDNIKDISYPPTKEAFLKVHNAGLYYDMHEPFSKEERKKLIGKPYVDIKNNYLLRKYRSTGMIREIIPYRDGKKNGLGYKIIANPFSFRVTSYKNDKKDGYEIVYNTKVLYKKSSKNEPIRYLLNGDFEVEELSQKGYEIVSKILYKEGKKVDE